MAAAEGSIRIAVAQTTVTTDPGVNGAAVRAAMRRAADQGARLVHFGEGALSGYAGAAKSHYTGWSIDWAPVAAELRRTMALAAELGIWVVLGGNHRLTGANRPHNSLWVINDRGELADRYDKRFLSHSEVTGFYTPGDHACVFDVDGFRFGCLLCIEVNFPELWMEQLTLGVDCVLFSTYSDDPIFEIIARGHAAANNFWVSIALPAQCAPSGPSALVGPHGYLLRQARPDSPDVICADLNRADPTLDFALNKARPWRGTARAGHLYTTHQTSDPRSADRTAI
ncbi:carbon-nitrogen hydrolase family protein [Actinoplanes derwentensis]|uniref:Predicted amidohydrolase n=1 Tax=Actinoplanes derwentensis TaxID=113562 RepID=A0A1H1R2P0_9ACTN|nr:carbon-nitrogen hydrolase family protein [Actinoplanes derwentensis]GID87996.1 amidohydrolase [Actinoplanes derwentensis]SDS29900.1 Predicted amidohydrolase [Actinoplanes derwentensis]